jgi:hypothetical protein
MVFGRTARRTTATSSSTKRIAPRSVFAEPCRIRFLLTPNIKRLTAQELLVDRPASRAPESVDRGLA